MFKIKLLKKEHIDYVGKSFISGGNVYHIDNKAENNKEYNISYMNGDIPSKLTLNILTTDTYIKLNIWRLVN